MIIKKFKKSIGQFLKFGVVGGIGFVVDMGSYFIMTRFLGVTTVFCLGGSFAGNSYVAKLAPEPSQSCAIGFSPLILATMFSVFLAICSNFILNKFWTFSGTGGNVATQGARYFALNIFTWFLNQALVAYFVTHLVFVEARFPHYIDVIAKVLAVAIILFFNFFGAKLVVFRKKEEGATLP